MIRRPPRSTHCISSAASDVYKRQLQVFEGDVICQSRNGISSTFTVRKISANSVAIERIFPVFSPLIDSIKVVRRGAVRRAKLYYLRDRVGKAARVKEKIVKVVKPAKAA